MAVIDLNSGSKPQERVAGRVIDLNTGGFIAPDSQTSQVVPAASDIPSEEPQSSLGQDALNVMGELAAGANRSVTEFIDFLGPDTVNSILSLAGSDSRVPTLTGALEPTGIQGGFMDEGLGRDLVQAAGETIPAAASFAPAVGRNLTSAGGAAAELLGFGSAAPQAAVNVASKVADNTDKKLALLRQSGDVAAAGFKLDDAGNVVEDAVQKQAMKVGVREGAVAMLSASSKKTKSRVNEMINIVEQGAKNLKTQALNRPSQVVGEALVDRLKPIQSANRLAGSNIDKVANSLRGKPVDVSGAIGSFLDDLAKEDIIFNPKTGALDFSGSSIEGLVEPQNIIKRTVKRLYEAKDPTKNAYKVHTAKRFLDEQVSYGKTQAGLSGKMEGMIKRLRRNLDGALDSTYPEYDQVNTVYKETRDAIDAVQDVAGSKTDLSGDNVEKALGIMSRKILSNYSSGTKALNTFNMLDDVARRYSTPLSDNIDDSLIELVAAESEIRKLFPESVAANTFQGSVASGVAAGTAEIASGGKATLTRLANEKIGQALSKSEKEIREYRISALRDLLK